MATKMSCIINYSVADCWISLKKIINAIDWNINKNGGTVMYMYNNVSKTVFKHHKT